MAFVYGPPKSGNIRDIELSHNLLSAHSRITGHPLTLVLLE